MITRGYLCRFAGAALAVVALAGCQSSDDAASTPPSPVRPTQVSTSPTPTASSTAPTASADAWARVPQAARAHTFAGAQAFAEFYVGQINKAWTVPDPELLRPYGLPSCKSCAAYVDTAESLANTGRRYDGDPGKIRASAWQPDSRGADVQVRVVAEQCPRHIVDNRGRVTERTTQRQFELAFDVKWNRGTWRVGEIKQVVVRK
jgi:hypothetical protein